MLRRVAISLKSQLEGLDRARFRHVIAFFHHPAFSSGPHGAARVEPPTAALRERYMPLFRRHRAAILSAGTSICSSIGSSATKTAQAGSTGSITSQPAEAERRSISIVASLTCAHI